MSLYFAVRVILSLSAFLLLRFIDTKWYPDLAPIKYTNASPINLAYKNMIYYHQSLVTKENIDRYYNEVENKSKLQLWTKYVKMRDCSQTGSCIGNLPPIRRIPSDFIISQKYQLLSCLVQKSMSTIVASSLCYLDQPEQFTAQNRSLTKESGHNSLCGMRAYFPGMISLKRELRVTRSHMKNLDIFMIIRDPMQRFISGYLDRCVRGIDACYGCARNFTCFTESLHRRLQDFSAGTNPRPIDNTDIHFFPQRWRCHESDFMRPYSYIHMESNKTKTAMELDKLLGKVKVPEPHRRFLVQQLSSKSTAHSTSNTKVKKFLMKKLTETPYLFSLFVKMFYVDYEAYNYELPVYRHTV